MFLNSDGPSSAKSHDFVCFFKVLEKRETCQKSPDFFRDVFRIRKVSRFTKNYIITSVIFKI
jgi:hypothetical protein